MVDKHVNALVFVVAIISFMGGVGAAGFFMSEERIAKMENVNNWECKTKLVFNPKKNQE